MTRGSRSPVFVCLILLTELCLSHAVQANNGYREKEVAFHIAPQQLESALLEFSRQADVQVAIASDSVRNVEVRGIEGRLTAIQALGLLLRDSGFSYSLLGDTVMVTRSKQSQDLSQPEAGIHH
jgi:outer-membrane receptor for ferric coprogen and ferric-rhodotorulic acid